MNRPTLAGLAIAAALLVAPGAHPAAAAGPPYVKVCHSTLSVGPTTSKLWVKSSEEPQRTVAKGACTSVYDGDGTARVYVSYPGWRARSNTGAPPWGPCHAGYSWSDPGLSSSGYSYRGFWNSFCG